MRTYVKINIHKHTRTDNLTAFMIDDQMCVCCKLNESR